MKPNLKHLMITLLAGLALAGSAAAQTTGNDARQSHAMTQEQRHAKWQAMAEKREAKLHDALQLTAAQEPAWTTYIAAMKPAGAMHGQHGAMAALPAPARMEQAIERSKQRTVAMEARLGTLKTFYAVLTPAQQTVFDQQTEHHGRRHAHMMRG